VRAEGEISSSLVLLISDLGSVKRMTNDKKNFDKKIFLVTTKLYVHMMTYDNSHSLWLSAFGFQQLSLFVE
jgi:hypothetical protein